jgi:hypothetical protein
LESIMCAFVRDVSRRASLDAAADLTGADATAPTHQPIIPEPTNDAAASRAPATLPVARAHSKGRRR